MPTPYPVELLNGPAYLALPRHETPWLVQSLIPLSGSTLIFAPPKQGKTSAILGLASGIADPEMEDFFGLHISQHGPVAYLQLDTPSELFQGEYVEKMTEQGKLNFDNVYFHDRETIPRPLDPFNILNPIHAEWLRAWIDAVKPVAVIIDTWRMVFRGAEKDDDLTTTVLQALRKATEPASLLIVHHNRKPAAGAPVDTSDEATVAEARGSTNLTGMCDVLWRLSRKKWTVRGRGGDMTIPIKFEVETGLPYLGNDLSAIVRVILKDPSLSSDRARAAKLSELSGISFEAARSRIRRG